METIQGNPWNVFSVELTALNMDTQAAASYFLLDYQIARCIYTDEYILKIFYKVHDVNAKKYAKLLSVYQATYDPIKNYDMTEESTDTRTPNLLTSSTASTETTSTIKNNQTRNTTETPNNFTETATRSVNPYDNTGLRIESSNENVQSGTRTTSESYTGNADTTSQNGTSSTTATTSGTDTNYHVLARSGNIGVTTSQQMLTSELELAERMNIFEVFEKDIAEQLFLQVW